MKKASIIFLIMVAFITLVACQEKESYLKLFDDLIPKEIDGNFNLPNFYNDETLQWESDDVIISNNLLNYPYLKHDQDIVIKTKIKNKVGKVKVKLLASNFVNDIYVNTKDFSNITSKEEYVDMTFSLKGTEAFEVNDLAGGIRGRGNSTWGYPKKPYRIKFKDRQSLLGMAAAKNYVLLAEYNDKSLMRNYLAHYFSSFLNIPHKLETRYVNLYLNGVYEGIYLLTEQVQIDGNRFDIDQSEVSDGGFLVELERDYNRAAAEGVENINWFRLDNPNPFDRNRPNLNAHLEVYYVLKYPKEKDFDNNNIMKNKINYISNYFSFFEKSIELKTYDEYIDVDNFIDYFIVSELFKQVDIGYSSVFINKDIDGLMKMGPIWDFDISSGNGHYIAYGYKGYWSDYNPWFGLLIKDDKFEEKFIQRYEEISNLYFDKLIEEIDFVYLNIYEHANRNFQKHTILNEYVWPNPPEMVEANTYFKQMMYLKTYLINRNNWLLQELREKGYYGFMKSADEGWIS